MRLRYVILLLFLVFQLGGCSHFGDGEKTTPGEGEKTVVKSETGTSDTSKSDNGAQSDGSLPTTQESGSNDTSPSDANAIKPGEVPSGTSKSESNNGAQSDGSLPTTQESGSNDTSPPDAKTTNGKSDDQSSSPGGSDQSQTFTNVTGDNPVPVNDKPTPDAGKTRITSPIEAGWKQCLAVKIADDQYLPLLNKDGDSYIACESPTSCEKDKNKKLTESEVQEKIVVLMSKEEVEKLQTLLNELAESIKNDPAKVDEKKVQELQDTLRASLNDTGNLLPTPPTQTLTANLAMLIKDANSAEQEVLVKYLKKREILLSESVLKGQPIEWGAWNPDTGSWGFQKTALDNTDRKYVPVFPKERLSKMGITIKPEQEYFWVPLSGYLP